MVGGTTVTLCAGSRTDPKKIWRLLFSPKPERSRRRRNGETQFRKLTAMNTTITQAIYLAAIQQLKDEKISRVYAKAA
jgi:hypothetical protein